MATATANRVRVNDRAMLRARARVWASLKHKIDDLAIELSIAGKDLKRLMRRQRTTAVEYGSDVIQLIIQKQKRPGKGDIVEFFGETRGGAFWEKLPDRISEYLTFATLDRAGQGR